MILQLPIKGHLLLLSLQPKSFSQTQTVSRNKTQIKNLQQEPFLFVLRATSCSSSSLEAADQSRKEERRVFVLFDFNGKGDGIVGFLGWGCSCPSDISQQDFNLSWIGDNSWRVGAGVRGVWSRGQTDWNITEFFCADYVVLFIYFWGFFVWICIETNEQNFVVQWLQSYLLPLELGRS